MIHGVHKVVIGVVDQEKSKSFWTEKMGFTVARDLPYAEGSRWIEVLSPDGATRLVLDPNTPRRTEGMQDDLPHSNVFFYADDIEKTYEELSEKGVVFPTPPVKQPWGWWSTFEDEAGTRYALSQRD
ncbi:glyoxalase/bleomycin resistance protein/dioxygenase superfamily protein [Herbihabitans rhizosphaerae]|uniref:Glyoxalase/bleomycin resistance protein/dioxygenase superfamily protein n=1 Tax=Herbihabitans rhizosphaerae TaxID=1872711 RepID=A0A4Q7KEW3_9PSEU|nr:VOC family protein [Herbihabitans rhizosphaerae]RZS32804.1 glyoxalase/bleomycin resistance protein/dioxygenase superfamily protein [Herbihabitans rhizosphaerae]